MKFASRNLLLSLFTLSLPAFAGPSMGGEIALFLIGWLVAHAIGALVIFASLLGLIRYFFNRNFWLGIGGIFLIPVTIYSFSHFVKKSISEDFSNICKAEASVKIYTTQRITTDTIYVPFPSRDNRINDGYLDISEEPLNDSKYGFKYVETDHHSRDGKPHEKIFLNANQSVGIDTPKSEIELKQTITRHTTKKYYSIDKSTLVIRNLKTREILAERTVLAFYPEISLLSLVNSFFIPSKMYCGDTPTQGDWRYSSYNAHDAWGRRALAFVRMVVNPISESPNTSTR